MLIRLAAKNFRFVEAGALQHYKVEQIVKQFDPFPEVSCKYGAPMGRHGDNPSNLQGVKRLHARRQGGGQGYDRGGAYWGTPSNVWGVWAWLDGRVVCTYVRAWSREEAIQKVRDGE